MIGRDVVFPDTYAAYPTAELLKVYGAGPVRVRAAIGGLSLEEMRARPAPGGWSVLETVAHVADAELMGAARMRMALAQPGAHLPAYTQDDWAREMEYQDFSEEDLARVLGLFGALRRTTLRILPAPGDPRWANPARHAELGPLTLRNLLELYADHAERHVEQIAETRALIGRPVDLPALLPERLF